MLGRLAWRWLTRGVPRPVDARLLARGCMLVSACAQWAERRAFLHEIADDAAEADRCREEALAYRAVLAAVEELDRMREREFSRRRRQRGPG